MAGDGEMIALNFPQGSNEWLMARLWRLTGSEMKKSLTDGGKLQKSKAATAHLDKLIAGIECANVVGSGSVNIEDMKDYELLEFLGGYTGDRFKGSIHTRRGNDLEADAMAALGKKVGVQFHDVGMCLMGDDPNSVVSCSPDGLVFDNSGEVIAGGEVKAPSLCNWITMMINKELPETYKLQVHTSMAICEVDEWHWGGYAQGKPIFPITVKRDHFTDLVGESLNEFKDVYRDRFEKYNEELYKLENPPTPELETVL
jgi:hypothetical protein